MNRLNFRDKKWYPYTFAACVGVILYVALTHLSDIGAALKTFGGFFSPLVVGAIIAYLINPLAVLYQNKVFKRIKSERLTWPLSIGLAMLSVLLVFGFLLGTLIPQLVASAMTLVDNMGGYMDSLKMLTDRMGLAEFLKLDQLLNSSENIIKTVTTYISNNYQTILSASATAGKGVVNWLIAFVSEESMVGP